MTLITREAEGDRNDQSLLEYPLPESVPALSRSSIGKEALSADAETDFVRARMPTPQEEPSGERRIVEFPPASKEPDREGGEKPRAQFPKRHPLLFVLGLISLAVAATAGYLYWDYAQHFQTTDDAFIAARQFAVAPKVSGYITAVPVTDNQHVAAGDVIARIDDRDYRIALDQARGAGGDGASQHREHRRSDYVQQAQINANQAQVEQAQAALVFAQQQAARYQDLAQKGSGTVQNAQQYTSQLRQQQAALESAQANLQLAQRQIESLKAQRNSAVASLAAGQGPARPGAIESFLYDRDGGAAGARRQSRPLPSANSLNPART